MKRFAYIILLFVLLSAMGTLQGQEAKVTIDTVTRADVQVIQVQ